ncbi:hypothetical protein [Actinomadura oligospora]|uniref:hypothetical protein n=1 Tax=Actinomadura oligospora TaxID=111804 RepID=UPI00047D1DFE|nr:hypothetical protein [Actinomadura oligospora]
MGDYSYTTIVVEPGRSPQIGVSLHGGESVTVLASTKGDAAQVSVMQGDVHVTFTPGNKTAVTPEDVKSARELAEAFAAYAAKVERLQEQHTASSTSGRAA